MKTLRLWRFKVTFDYVTDGWCKAGGTLASDDPDVTVATPARCPACTRKTHVGMNGRYRRHKAVSR